MANFWDSLGNINRQNNNSFNIQDFMRFYNENKGKDMNQALNQLLQSGKISQQQLDSATAQAKNVLQMLQSMGLVK